jgi:type IV pilus assembly protein PilC
MAVFDYQARTRSGELRSGVVETSSQEAALDILQREGLLVVSVSERKKTSLLETRLGSGISQKDVVIFSRQLATLFESHIPVIEALKTLAGGTTKKVLREIIADILDDVNGGLSLSQTFTKHPEMFSSFYIHLVRSGEESGRLQEVFTYLADYLERSYYLASKARNSLIYPAFVLFAFIAVLIVMLIVVIPRLTEIFQETGQDIPLYTRMVIAISSSLRSGGPFLLFLLVAGSFFLWRWGMTSSGRFFFHRLQISLPVLGELYRKLYMARLADNLRTLIIGGIPIIRALEITGEVVGNDVYRNALSNAMESVKAGSTIGAAFEKNSEIPFLFTQMVKIGESAGRLDAILASIAKFYQRDVDVALDNLVALIEPALIIFLGVGIGILVASVLVPLYNLVGSI